MRKKSTQNNEAPSLSSTDRKILAYLRKENESITDANVYDIAAGTRLREEDIWESLLKLRNAGIER